MKSKSNTIFDTHFFLFQVCFYHCWIDWILMFSQCLKQIYFFVKQNMVLNFSSFIPLLDRQFCYICWLIKRIVYYSVFKHKNWAKSEKVYNGSLVLNHTAFVIFPIVKMIFEFCSLLSFLCYQSFFKVGPIVLIVVVPYVNFLRGLNSCNNLSLACSLT